MNESAATKVQQNARSYPQPLISICDSLANDPNYFHLLVALEGRRFGIVGPGLTPNQLRYAWVRSLHEELKAYHQPIEKDLCSGAGIALQRIDSDIASEIMWHFTQQKIPLIPIHDSFIIAERYSSELKTVMAEVYYRRFGQSIGIK